MNLIPTIINFFTPLVTYLIPPVLPPMLPPEQPKVIQQQEVHKPSSNIDNSSINTNNSNSYQVLASWYGPGFDGNFTASGAVFNQYDLTVAHPTYPFGTRLEISYKGNSVVATVTDRGPFKHVNGEYFTEDRGIDLSKGTAQAIGFDGVNVVTVTRLN